MQWWFGIVRESSLLFSSQWQTLASIKHAKHTHCVFGTSSVGQKTSDLGIFQRNHRMVNQPDDAPQLL